MFVINYRYKNMREYAQGFIFGSFSDTSGRSACPPVRAASVARRTQALRGPLDGFLRGCTEMGPRDKASGVLLAGCSSGRVVLIKPESGSTPAWVPA